MDPKTVTPLGCGETVFNHPALANQKLEPGNKYNINCLNSCVTEGKKVFGEGTYE